MGDMKRQFQRPELMIGNPDNLQRETVFPTEGRAALDELLNKNYANPAGPNGVTESQNNKRTNDILEAILKVQAERTHREGAAREFAGTTSDDLRSAADWVERRFDIPAGAVRFATESIGERMGFWNRTSPASAIVPEPARPEEDERRMAQAEEDERLTAAATRRRRTLPERPPANPDEYVAPYRPPQPRVAPSSETTFRFGLGIPSFGGTYGFTPIEEEL